MKFYPVSDDDVPCLAVGDVRNAKISIAAALDEGELATGTPTIAEVRTTDLTITNEAVNTSAETIEGVSTAIGKAILFKVSGQLASREYRLVVTVTTDSTPAQTRKFGVRFRAVALS